MNNFSLLSVSGSMTPIIILLVISDLILRGVSLYRSAQKGQTVWFVALLIINSLGVLPIIYLLINKDIRLSKQASAPRKVAAKTTKRSRR